MKLARMFNNDGFERIVTAYDVKEGRIDQSTQFTDLEYEFRVQYVSKAKNNGAPYFRLYLSLEDYTNYHMQKKTRFDIIKNMRKYKESKWHLEWKENLKSFCSIEKTIKNNETKKYKFADAFYEEKKTVIEFQHSFIDFDFESRNEFYSSLGYTIIWLYDLSKFDVLEHDGYADILEDNAKGFFKIASKPENLFNNNVYIETKEGIYRVRSLERKEINGKLDSTIRYFEITEKYTRNEFISKIKENKRVHLFPQTLELKSLDNLWSRHYSSMRVLNCTTQDVLMIINDYKDKSKIARNPNGCILARKEKQSSHIRTSLFPLKKIETKKEQWCILSANYK